MKKARKRELLCNSQTERREKSWNDQFEKHMEAVLLETKMDDLDAFFEDYASQLFGPDKAFAKYMRGKFKEKQISQKDVFEKANISAKYGYKLISEEKKTSQRDMIIKLCLLLGMTVSETQKALVLSGFSELHIYVKRDVILMALLNNEINSIPIVNSYLARYEQEPLYEGKKEKEND